MKELTRREFLRLSAMTAAGVASAACAPATPIVIEKEVTREVQVEVEKTVVVEKEVTKEVVKEVEVEKTVIVEVTPTAGPTMYNEPPALTELVASGALPPVDERVPQEPLVVYPTEIGQYGGTLTVGTISTNYYGGDAGRYPVQELLLRYTPDLTNVIPNILTRWQANEDFTEVTCFMRKGLKWSDGAPCTADDYLFFWDDNLYNESVQPTREAFLEPGGIRSRVEKIDDFTFKVIFGLPNPGFVDMKMAHVSNIDVVLEPKHYLQQFHATYNSNADALAKQEGFDNWSQLFLNRRNRDRNLDKPVLECMEPVTDTPEAVFHNRNAYFFMLDSEGNQLPYIDEMLVNRVADLEMLNAKTIGAQFDFSAFDISIENYPAYDDGAEQGDYHIVLWPSGKGGEVVYNFNMNWNMEEGIPTDQQEPDMWRDVFSDVRFRRAMSLAINRDEINDIIFFGRGIPRQMTVIPQSRFFKPEYAEAWAQYDPDQANALLDEIGLQWDDAGQQRLWPDGTPINISWDIFESETPKGPITELVNEYWGAVGIVTSYKSITRDLLAEKVLANQEPISLWHGDETGDSLFLRGPKFFTPENGDESAWAVYWGLWYDTHGERGVEPPPEIKDLYEAQDLYHRTAGPEGPQVVLESQAENVWTIGTVGMAPHPLVVKNRLHNVAETGLWTWDSLWTWPTFPETWFLTEV